MTETTASPVTLVKTNNVRPFDGAGMTTAQIMNILHGLDPGAVAEAGAAHTNLGQELDTMAAGLTRHAQTLAQNWTGTAAQTAMARFQQLHDQTSALAAQAAQTGSALTWLGTHVLPKFQQLQTPTTGSALGTDAVIGGMAGAVVAGPIGAVAGTAAGGLDAILSASGAAAAQAQAQKYLSALSSYLVTANSYLPDQIGGVANRPAGAGGGPQAGNGTGGGGTGGAGTGRTVNGRRATGSNGPVGGAGGNGSGLGAGGTASGTGVTGPAPGAAGTGSAPRAGGAGGLAAGGAGGNVGGAGTATPVPAVSSLQSAAPVPGGTPGAAPVPVSAASSASAASGTGNLGAGAANSLSPVPIVPGLAGPAAAGGGRSGRGADGGTRDPAAAAMLPGAPADGGALPDVPGLGGAPAGGLSPLGEVRGPAVGLTPLGEVGSPASGLSPLGEARSLDGLDGGLSGGATPLPEVPGPNAPGAGAAVSAVSAAEAGSSAVVADGPGTPGSGDAPQRNGLGGMPMAGVGSGQPEQERARRVWAYEDENIWGLPPGCVPPLIEGG